MDRRWMDFLILLTISLVIASATAATYNLVFMEGSPIGVDTPYIRFVSGSDATSTIGQNGTYARITSMQGWPNATRVYEDALRIENLDATPHSCELIFDSWSGDTGNINSIYVKIFDTVGGTQQGSTLSITAQNSTGTFNLPATTTYYVQWEIRWDGNALSTNTVDVTLSLRV